MSTNVNQSWISEQLSRAFQDQLMYGESMMYINPSNDPEPNITRLDPTVSSFNGLYLNNLIMEEAWSGRGLEDQISNASTNYFSTATVNDFRNALSMLTSSTGTSTTNLGSNPYTWHVITGEQGYRNLSNSLRDYIIDSNGMDVQFNEAENDISGNNIIITKSQDHGVFSIEIFKENMKITATTKKGSKREYDLFLKNAKRGTYINTKNIKWKYEQYNK